MIAQQMMTKSEMQLLVFTNLWKKLFFNQKEVMDHLERLIGRDELAS